MRRLLIALLALFAGQAWAQVTLTQGQAANLDGSSTPAPFSFSPQQNWWNLIAVGSMTPTGVPVGIEIGGKASNPTSAASNNNFLVANGNWGTISSTSGSASAPFQAQFVDAALYHAQVSQALIDTGSFTVNLTATQVSGNTLGQFIHIWEVFIPVDEEGVRNVKINKTGNLLTWKWSVFAPGTNSSWRARAERTYGEFDLPSTNNSNEPINFSQPGYWCIAVFSDFSNGVPTTGTSVSVEVTTPSSGGSGGGGGRDEGCSTRAGAGAWLAWLCSIAAALLALRRIRVSRVAHGGGR